jgi:hypothetical protein
MKSMSSRAMAKSWPYTRYKSFEESLRVSAASWFRAKGCPTHPRMNYCLLSHDLWSQNIICKDVADYIKQEKHRNLGKDSFPLHKYLHHGLSSQAMIFNLLGPLMVRGDVNILKNSFQKVGIDWPDGEIKTFFEHDDRLVFNEDSGQPTSIDAVVSGEKKSIFIEAKLVEKEFGGCSVFAGGDCEGRNPYPDNLDSCYLHHIGRKYWTRLDELGLSKSSIFRESICPFANYYQFFREVMFAFAKNGTFLLLYDERNPAFLRLHNNSQLQGGLWPFLEESIPKELRHLIGKISIQTIVEAIDGSGRHSDWILNFRQKYGIQ